MYEICKREQFGPTTFLLEFYAPEIAQAAQPGQFVMLRLHEQGERIPLTIADYDAHRGTITIVIQAVGKTTWEMFELQVGAKLLDVLGPLGIPSAIHKKDKVILVGGGLGVAPIYPQLKLYKELGSYTIAIVGFRQRELMFWYDKFQAYADELRVATDDGSFGTKGLVTVVLKEILEREQISPTLLKSPNATSTEATPLALTNQISEVVAIGPLVMMRACSEVTRAYGVPTVVSLNSLMVDGTGMCGSCRVNVGGKTKFACVDGPDFDAHQVDFAELLLRQKRFNREEKAALALYEQEKAAKTSLAITNPHEHPIRTQPPETPNRACPFKTYMAEKTTCGHELPPPSSPLLTAKKARKTLKDLAPKKTPISEQLAKVRRHNFQEVCNSYSLAEAIQEAERCLNCPKPLCVSGCPVSINIPGFISALSQQDIPEAYKILRAQNALPAICGRVCPQETQCEAVCIVGNKLEPVAIGRLERFVADYYRSNFLEPAQQPAELTNSPHYEPLAVSGDDSQERTPLTTLSLLPSLSKPLQRSKKAAIIGSGPAGLACAEVLAKAGVKVTVYEALHIAGGVLRYGIPAFRLPREVITSEIADLQQLGVEFRLNTVIGKTLTIDQLLGKLHYDTVFIGIGAGTPKFMQIPGEGLNGVFSANEFLTRVNLMHGETSKIYDTPIGMGKQVVVIGAGNTAMDSARVALRLGAESVKIIYRRSINECPARVEELHHALEEGVEFYWLHNPKRILGNSEGEVIGIELVDMELGEPDSSGRQSPKEKMGSEKTVAVDTVIFALGTSANSVLSAASPNLQLAKNGYIAVDEQTSMTSIPGVFAGGDIVTGSATVILAMHAGRYAGTHMLAYMNMLDKDSLSKLSKPFKKPLKRGSVGLNAC